jgi:hypothetical protein
MAAPIRLEKMVEVACRDVNLRPEIRNSSFSCFLPVQNPTIRIMIK